MRRNKLVDAHMPFEKGNTLGAKGKLFEQALKRAITQDDGKRLRAAAESLLTKASEGEAWALNMLADRLDGKPGQSVEVVRKQSLEDMSLDELRARVSEILAGEAAFGGDQSPAEGSGLAH